MIKRDSKGRFKKGSSNAWNKGLNKNIDERVKKQAESLQGNTCGFKKGNKFWDNVNTKKTQFKIGNIPWTQGRKLDEKQRKKISEKTKLGMTKKVCKRLSEIKKKAIKEGKLVLPKKDTSIEVKIQHFLKQLKIDFFTHQYMKIEHGYQCDILIPSMNLVIECDGDYWHNYPIGREIDHIRTSELLQKGFKVLRLWEFEIKEMDKNKLRNIIVEEMNR